LKNYSQIRQNIYVKQNS